MRLLPKSTDTAAGFDVIGDVHGDADRLKELLKKLDYTLTKGIWSHAGGRRAIFVGDLVDRGPKVRETLAIAKAMVDTGVALMVLGNHEFNLLALLTPDGNGGFLRPHTARNLKMVRTTLADFGGREAELLHYLVWFRTLPLHLDLGGCRVVHAEWNERLIARMNGRNLLDDEFFRLAATKGTSEHRTIDILLKGTEVPLPAGAITTDLDGTERHEVRVCWPLPASGRTYRDIALPSGPHIPDVPVPAGLAHEVPGYDLAEPPVFFGHYAIKGHKSGLIAPNAACLDHGCGKGGPLTAYRWTGERTLSPNNFFSA